MPDTDILTDADQMGTDDREAILRRRGAFGKALDRIQDDPLTAKNPAYDQPAAAPVTAATPGPELAELPMGPALRRLQARSQPSTMPVQPRPTEDPWLKSREAEYDKLNQPAAPLSLKQRILRAVVPAGIMAAGGLIGGRAGAAGAGQGVLQQEAVQRGEAEKQQALKEGRSRSLLQEIEAQKRTEEQERAAGMRAETAERGLSERARLAEEAETGRSQRLADVIKGEGERNTAAIAGRANVETARETAAERLANLKGTIQAANQQALERLRQSGRQALAQEIERGNYSPVPDAAGNITGWVNPKSRRFVSVEDIPQAGAAATGVAGATLPAKPSGMTAGAIAQAGAIQRAGDNLIAEINAKRGKIGNWTDYWQKAVIGSPISDPDLSGLATSLGSFAALQPRLHGFRGQQAMQGFEGLIGGIPKNPDALIASIRSIQKTAGAVVPPTGPGQSKDLGPAPPGAPEGATVRNRATGQRATVKGGKLIPIQ